MLAFISSPCSRLTGRRQFEPIPRPSGRSRCVSGNFTQRNPASLVRIYLGGRIAVAENRLDEWQRWQQRSGRDARHVVAVAQRAFQAGRHRWCRFPQLLLDDGGRLRLADAGCQQRGSVHGLAGHEHHAGHRDGARHAGRRDRGYRRSPPPGHLQPCLARRDAVRRGRTAVRQHALAVAPAGVPAADRGGAGDPHAGDRLTGLRQRRAPGPRGCRGAEFARPEWLAHRRARAGRRADRTGWVARCVVHGRRGAGGRWTGAGVGRAARDPFAASPDVAAHDRRWTRGMALHGAHEVEAEPAAAPGRVLLLHFRHSRAAAGGLRQRHGLRTDAGALRRRRIREPGGARPASFRRNDRAAARRGTAAARLRAAGDRPGVDAMDHGRRAGLLWRRLAGSVEWPDDRRRSCNCRRRPGAVACRPSTPSAWPGSRWAGRYGAASRATSRSVPASYARQRRPWHCCCSRSGGRSRRRSDAVTSPRSRAATRAATMSP